MNNLYDDAVDRITAMDAQSRGRSFEGLKPYTVEMRQERATLLKSVHSLVGDHGTCAICDSGVFDVIGES